MKLPITIETLTELKNWTIIHKPKTIELYKNSKIRKIAEFNDYGKNQWKWKNFRGIPIRYLNFKK